MILIGLTGPIGHGKSSFAEALLTQAKPSLHLESSTLIAAVSDELHAQTITIPEADNLDQINQWLKNLPDILSQVVNIQTDFSHTQVSAESWQNQSIKHEKLVLHLKNLQQNPSLLGQSISSDNKNLYRPFLQWLGSYLVQRVDPGIWYKELIRQADQAKNNGYALCVIGGLRFPADANLVKSSNGIVVSVIRPSLGETDVTDPTERQRRKIKTDTKIINGGALPDLDIYAKQLVDDIRQNSLQNEYGTLPSKERVIQ